MSDYQRHALASIYTTFEDAGTSAEALLDLYRNSGVSLNPTSSLGRMVKDAIDLAQMWKRGETVDDRDPKPIIRGQHLHKIAQSALPLSSDASSKQHLLALKNGTIDPLDRQRSPAKDKLWELELWSALKDFGIDAMLEEPDVVATIEGYSIGFACKRIYSASNAANAMSKGVAQISKTNLTGVLALNIDDLVVPPECLVTAPNIRVASNALDQANSRFAGALERELLAYLSTGRAAAALISCAAPLYLEDEGIRECRQMMFWIHPNAGEEKVATMRLLERAMFDGLGRRWKEVDGNQQSWCESPRIS